MSARLHHPTHRNVMLVAHTQRPYPVPKWCDSCEESHTYKAYHLRLDDGGNVIVSDTVYERLLQATPVLAGCMVANEVKDPPPIKLSGFRPIPRGTKVAVFGEAVDLANDDRPVSHLRLAQ